MTAYREDAAENRSLLIIAAGGAVVAMRRDSGTVAWRFENVHEVFGLKANLGGAVDLAIHGSRVYVGLRNKIVCLDYLTGTVAGHVELPSQSFRPTFLIDGDHLYFTTNDRVMCFSLDGQILWQSPHGIGQLHGPAMGIPGNVRQGDATG